MKLSDYDYRIPENQIAMHPLKERDSSKLFVLHKNTNKFEHTIFNKLAAYLRPGDVLVLNDTKVIPARLPGIKPSGGKAEITLIKELERNTWEALVKGLHEGKIMLKHGITANVSRLNGAVARIKFSFNSDFPQKGKTDIRTFLHNIGVMPLPPYIKRDAVISDAERYQTVYAKNEGAVAAPTAGLHFTDNLINTIKKKGITVKTITLHVGYGTFKPVEADDIRSHHMDEETYEIPLSTADAINSAKEEGGRVFAVGTTVTRALEASASNDTSDRIEPGVGKTSIFIRLGYRFKILDALITNLHLPRSSPMMLVSAFSGLNLLKKAYSESQKAGYRFFSYGDAMLII